MDETNLSVYSFLYACPGLRAWLVYWFENVSEQFINECIIEEQAVQTRSPTTVTTNQLTTRGRNKLFDEALDAAFVKRFVPTKFQEAFSARLVLRSVSKRFVPDIFVGTVCPNQRSWNDWSHAAFVE